MSKDIKKTEAAYGFALRKGFFKNNSSGKEPSPYICRLPNGTILFTDTKEECDILKRTFGRTKPPNRNVSPRESKLPKGASLLLNNSLQGNSPLLIGNSQIQSAPLLIANAQRQNAPLLIANAQRQQNAPGSIANSGTSQLMIANAQGQQNAPGSNAQGSNAQGQQNAPGSNAPGSNAQGSNAQGPQNAEGQNAEEPNAEVPNTEVPQNDEGPNYEEPNDGNSNNSGHYDNIEAGLLGETGPMAKGKGKGTGKGSQLSIEGQPKPKKNRSREKNNPRNSSSAAVNRMFAIGNSEERQQLAINNSGLSDPTARRRITNEEREVVETMESITTPSLLLQNKPSEGKPSKGKNQSEVETVNLSKLSANNIFRANNSEENIQIISRLQNKSGINAVAVFVPEKFNKVIAQLSAVIIPEKNNNNNWATNRSNSSNNSDPQNLEELSLDDSDKLEDLQFAIREIFKKTIQNFIKSESDDHDKKFIYYADLSNIEGIKFFGSQFEKLTGYNFNEAIIRLNFYTQLFRLDKPESLINLGNHLELFSKEFAEFIEQLDSFAKFLTADMDNESSENINKITKLKRDLEKIKEIKELFESNFSKIFRDYDFDLFSSDKIFNYVLNLFIKDEDILAKFKKFTKSNHTNKSNKDLIDACRKQTGINSKNMNDNSLRFLLFLSTISKSNKIEEISLFIMLIDQIEDPALKEIIKRILSENKNESNIIKIGNLFENQEFMKFYREKRDKISELDR